MKLPFQASDEQMMWQVQTAADAGAFAELVRRWEEPIQRIRPGKCSSGRLEGRGRLLA